MTSGSPAAAAPPVVPRAFAAVQGLGAARVVASVPRARRAGYSTGLLVAWAVSILLGGFVIAIFAQIIFEFDDVVFLAIAGVLWVAGFWIVLRWLRRKGAQVVVLYEQGIAVGDGRAVRQWRWEDFVRIERRPIVHELKPELPTDVGSAMTAAGVLAVLAAFRVTKRSYVRIDSYHWFFDRSGGSFTLDRWLPSVDGLAEAIDLEITERMLPGARAALADGRSIGFGAMELSKDTLTVSGQVLPVASVDRIVVDKDALQVVAGGQPRARVLVAQVANLTLLGELIEELRPARA